MVRTEPEWTDVAARAEDLAGDIVEWRRHLHAHPELAFEEHETAAFVVERLQSVGCYEIHEAVAGTGVVADLPGRTGAPMVALRADMDALPINENPARPFRSVHPGRMHACGHDGHIAMLLGAAMLLPTLVSPASAGVRLLFQPSEETVGADGRSGAQRMVDEGALDGVRSVHALHLDPTIPVGAARLSSGYATAHVDTFHAVIKGAGGHGARPDATIDPIWMLGPVLGAIQSIVSRRVSPLDPAVLSVCRLEAGSALNAIPSEVVVEGTIRSFRPEVRAVLRDELERALALTRPLGGDFELRVETENPGVCNDAGACEELAQAARSLWSEFSFLGGPYGMLGEDFSFMAQRVPAAIAMIGCQPLGRAAELHSPDFDIDERALPIGAALLAATARIAGLS